MDPDPDWESGSGPRQTKIVPQIKEKLINFIFIEFSVKLEVSPGF
jgi:hypothetical protein